MPAISASRVDFNIPVDVRLGIADAIMAFSHLEMTAEMMIFDMLKLSFDDGRLITGTMVTNRKFELFHDLLDTKLPTDSPYRKIDRAWRATDTVISARNKIAHGVWAMLDGQTPFVVSYRFEGGPQTVAGEEFPLGRLRAVRRLSLRLRALLSRLAEDMKLPHVGFSRPPQRAQANHPPDLRR